MVKLFTSACISHTYFCADEAQRVLGSR